MIHCRHKGQTLLEVIIATGVLSVGLIAVLSLVTQSLLVSGSSKYRTQATFYAQDAIDRITSVQNANADPDSWYYGSGWDYNFYTSDGWYTYGECCYGGYFEFNYNGPTEKHDMDVWGMGDSFLTEIDGKKFKRYIHIEAYEGRNDARKVSVKVTWPDSRGEQQVEISTILTNWQQI